MYVYILVVVEPFFLESPNKKVRCHSDSLTSTLEKKKHIETQTLSFFNPLEETIGKAKSMDPSTHDESVKREDKPMETITNIPTKKEVNKGAWTPEEDRKLAQVIAIHGAKRWKIIAATAGLNRCGKSCRLRWLNYLRPNIKRGNISDQEEDLILRLHKLLGNRWSLIAGRLPGRTDNEIKNYWNSHLSKKINQKEKQSGASTREESMDGKMTAEKVDIVEVREENMSCNNTREEDSNASFNVDDFLDFSNEDPLDLEWMNNFLEMDEGFTSM